MSASSKSSISGSVDDAFHPPASLTVSTKKAACADALTEGCAKWYAVRMRPAACAPAQFWKKSGSVCAGGEKRKVGERAPAARQKKV